MRSERTALGRRGSLDRVLGLLSAFPKPWHFAMGNHDVANFEYPELAEALRVNASGLVPQGARAIYSTFSPAQGAAP